MAAHPEATIVEMDTVHGTRSGPVLLTMLFRSCGFMLVFLLEHDTQECVCQVFEHIEKAIGLESVRETFGVILTDNGSEFKNPALIERNLAGESRTRVFYCDPMASWQKGRLERNHEFIRYILPKGHPLDFLTKGKVCQMMNHINSTARASLNGRTPFELALLLLPAALLHWAGATAIPHDDRLFAPDTSGFFCISSSSLRWILTLHLTFRFCGCSVIELYRLGRLMPDSLRFSRL